MKFFNRYENLLKKYYLKQDIGAVLYICKNEAILKRVQAIDKALSTKYTPKFYYALLEDVLCSDNKKPFTKLKVNQ